MDWLILVSIWLGIAVIYFAGPTYLREKGKNAATREDIGAITRIVEQVRSETHEDIEHLKATISDISEATVRRRNVYERLSGALRIFVQGQFPEPRVHIERQQDFLDSYVASWLWAPDDLIRTLNSFILMNQRKPAEDNPGQRELKEAFFRVLLQMRRNAGFPDTELEFEDLVFVQL
ncbi:hypothetical protein [Candidatus Kuenenia sp.]|uniref:hypothetical protein n=1 Tax=Candidatus Kuenenia sp. TaxID=2499824 RepID=UPI0032203CEF